MTKIKSTKRALLLSAVSILLCACMFVGTTFAWFTDTVSSDRNIIQSGNLDVELYYALSAEDVENDNWEKVTAETDVFGYTLWEPGHTRVAYFKVANEGSLALKYQLTADVFQETAGVNKDEDTFLLSDYLYTEIVDVDATRESILASTTGTKFKGSIPMSEMGKLVAKGKEDATEGTVSEQIIGLAIWMPTSTGNEANHDGKNIPTIQFGINLVATQLDAEIDSFGPDYDKDAVYADAFATDAESLAEAIAEGGIVALMNDIKLSDAPITVAADTVIDLNGNTLSGISTSSTTSNLIKVAKDTTLTLKNGTVTFGATTPDTNWGGEGQPAFPGYANNTINCSGTLIIDGATVINTTAAGGASYAIDCYPGADLIINDGLVDGLDKVAIRTFANSNTVPTNVTINGGTVKGRRSVWVQLPSSNETMIQPVNLTVNGGTLVSTDSTENLVIYSYSYGTNFDGVNIALNGGSYYGDVALGGGGKNGVKYGKENVTVDTANCKFYGAKGVYSYNTGDADVEFEVVAAPNASGVAAYDNDSLKNALASGKDVAILEDVEVEQVKDSNIAYGNPVGAAVKAGAVLDGNGNTISVGGDGGYVVYAESGSTIKNVVINDGQRGIMIGYNPTEDITIENVVVDGPGYAINTTECDRRASIVVKDSTLNGWLSFGLIKSASFTNCKFGENTTKFWQNMGYDQDYDRLVRPYVTATFTDCEFEQGYYVDLSALTSGETVTLTNCTCNGVVLTAENYADYITVEDYDASYITFN